MNNITSTTKINLFSSMVHLMRPRFSYAPMFTQLQYFDFSSSFFDFILV